MSISKEMRPLVRELFELMFPGWTDEDLLLYPRELRHFTHLVRVLVGLQSLESYAVTGALINERKKGGKGSGKPRKSSANILELEVKASRMSLTVDEFKEKVATVFLSDHGPKDVERVMRKYHHSMEFCRTVRASISGVGDLEVPDTMILRTLVSLRKAGRFRNGGQGVDDSSGEEEEES